MSLIGKQHEGQVMQIQIEMKLSKSTQGTHVYAAEDADAAVTTVYVKKTKLPASPPARVTLTLEVTDDD